MYPSRAEQPHFRTPQQRRAAARAFETGARAYHDARPGYPEEIIALLRGAHTVVDIGAGTGKLTAALARYHEVFALDPSAEMIHLAAHHAPAWRATAEHTGLADNSVDAAACAQTWHWVDTEQACAELDRIIRPGGHVLLAWNTLDVSDPWVLRLSRIMHAGDVLRPGFLPPVASPWIIAEELRTTWVDPLTPPEIIALARTRSYWLRSPAHIRRRVEANLEWYLYEHSGYGPGDTVSLPYRCDAFVLSRTRTAMRTGLP
ncbi:MULTISPECIES: class I SAM-dependent methyltransferase [unclassified Corynebacterium]|uniref:class I SAM-dependent methyltransferase n=1 Tax=unclassified Corynebacterium TaxID=2624378 RepID=UPI0029CA75FE|nr:MULTISPECIES: class I SAM-dependent methyltransferase [unclassified Corynebacterium]WPF67140.1 class I SAM-dependent methyltransferase [Corynebacterium sp. 22KM0430]WPF69628.1 class I SAM-dependent methyltransferase [Corynebacterium sp. 21KM1197]